MDRPCIAVVNDASVYLELVQELLEEEDYLTLPRNELRGTPLILHRFSPVHSLRCE